MQKKFELIKESKEVFREGHESITLYRIKALTDIPKYNVLVGDVGGFVASENNLSQNGSAWVADDAKIYGDARVHGDTLLKGEARVYGNVLIKGDIIISDNSRIYGDACIKDSTRISGTCEVFGNARITGRTTLEGNVRVSGKAQVRDSLIKDSARIQESALIIDSTISDCSVVCDESKVQESKLNGKAYVSGYAHVLHSEIFDDAVVSGRVVLNESTLRGDVKLVGCERLYNVPLISNANVFSLLMKMYDATDEDSITNIIGPTFVYFPNMLRYDADTGCETEPIDVILSENEKVTIAEFVEDACKKYGEAGRRKYEIMVELAKEYFNASGSKKSDGVKSVTSFF